MRAFQIAPVTVLRPFVDRIWGWESGDGEVVRLPILLPGTGAELYFHHGEPFRYLADDGRQAACPAAHLFCVRRSCVPLSPAPNVGFIAVRFRAGMLQRFTAIPAGELLDQVPAVEEIWGAAGRALRRDLSHGMTRGERLSRIQSFLVERLRGESSDPVAEKAVPMLYRQFSSISIQGLAEALHLGHRQFERRFMAFAGQSPGELKRLSRFQHTVRQLMLDASANPRDVALSNGYYDQAHFIRDFRQRTRATPGRYFAEARTKTHFYNTSRRADGMLPAPANTF